MASIAFTVTMTDGTQMSKTAQVSDADVGRLINWALGTWSAQVDAQGNVVLPLDANGNPIPRDGAWAVSQWIASTVTQTMTMIHLFEKQQAAQAAAAAVQPIAVTIS